MVALQAAFALAVGGVALASGGARGLLFTVASIILARVLWAAILTVRAAVWTANYPRNVIARITGRIVIVNSIAVASSAALVGWALDARVVDARWLYGGGALAGLAGAWLYRAMRVRREFQLLAAEGVGSGARSEPFSLAMFTLILREDPALPRVHVVDGVFGAGNLMITAQLVLLFTDRCTSPAARRSGCSPWCRCSRQPLFLPAWARLFDGSHMVRYRAAAGLGAGARHRRARRWGCS